MAKDGECEGLLMDELTPESSSDSEKQESDNNVDDIEAQSSRTVIKAQSSRTLIIGFIALLLLVSSYIIAIALAQVMGGKTNMFELNLFRFAIQTLLALIYEQFFKTSLKVARKDIWKFILVIPFNLVKSTIFYVAAEIMPVGDMDGLYVVFYIIFSTGFDLIMRRISKVSILASCLGVIGVILLCQPWLPWDTSKSPQFAPCDYLDNKSLVIMTPTFQNNTLNTTEVDWQHSHKYTLGLIYVVVTAISCTIGNNIFKSILLSYSVQCLLFWNGICESVMSALIMLLLKYFNNGHLSLPSGQACLGLTLFFVFIITFNAICSKIVYKSLPISKAALAAPFATVALYIMQRTFLKDFYPGHANIVEIIGIVLIFFCVIITPVISIFYENKPTPNPSA